MKLLILQSLPPPKVHIFSSAPCSRTQVLAVFVLQYATHEFVCRQALGAHPASSQWVPRAFSMGVNQPEREADHSPPPSAKVKNA